MSMWTLIVRKPYVIIGAGAMLAAGTFAWNLTRDNPPQLGLAAPTGRIELTSTPVPTEGLTEADLLRVDSAMADLAERASRSVVHIKSGQGRQRQGEPGMGQGVGSGFIVRPDGWIVTNDHVIGGAEEVTVILNDGREFTGKVRSANDPQADLAMVKIDAANLPALEFADSNQVRVGQFAMAIGSPFGFDNTVTVGHVSAMGRGNEILDPRFGFRGYNVMIQTDASINPGNSGGPLIDVRGRVIGVNTSIFSQFGGSVGIGFALPSNQARVVANLLIEEGKINRGMLGLIPEDLKPYERDKHNVQAGAIVREVESGGPAERAGIQAGDIVTQVGDRPITNQLDLRVKMYEVEPGTSVRVEYLRGGQTRSAEVQAATPPRVTMDNLRQRQEAPTMPEGLFRGDPFEGPWGELEDLFRNRERTPTPNAPPTDGRPMLGVQVQAIDSTMRRQFNIPADVQGVVVVNTLPGSFAERSGIRVGSVIERIDGQAIRTPEELTRAVQAIRPGATVDIQFTTYGPNTVQRGSVRAPLR